MSTEPTTTIPTEEEKPLFPIVLEESNIRGIKAFRHEFKGNVTTLTGPNGAGKSSVIDGLAWALLGRSVMPERPLREGTSHGGTFLDLGEITVELELAAAAAPKIVVRSKDRQRLKSPQAVLNALWNSMCDPMSFIRLGTTPEGRQRQARILQEIVGLDLKKYDDKRQELYGCRTDSNRLVEKLKIRLSQLRYDESAPMEKINVSDVVRRLDLVNKHNRANDQARQTLKNITAERDEALVTMEATRVEIEATLAKLNLLRGNAAVIQEDLAKLEASVAENTVKVNGLTDEDTGPLHTEAKTAEEMNNAWDMNQAYVAAKNALIEVEAEVVHYTKGITAIDEDRTDALAKAKLPLPGLTYTEEGIQFNNIPFDQINDAAKLKIGVAIGLALKPRLRVIVIREASMLDDMALAELRDWAVKENFHIIEEVNRTDDPAAIVIENGEIAVNRNAEP